MAYILSSTTIRNPKSLTESNSTQVAQNRTLSGAITRDYFGSNKRVWTLEFENAKKTDYDTINTIYTAYLSAGTGVSWEVTETNYTVASVTVHMDLVQRSFKVRGSDYISDFTLTLIEA